MKIFLLISTWACTAYGWFEHDRAVMAGSQGNWPQAHILMEKALIENAHDPEKLYDMGVVCYRQGNFEQARTYFSQVVSHEKTDAVLKEKALFNMGNSLAFLKEYEKAIAAYEQLPGNKKAQENIEILKKLLEQKQQQEEQKKDDENQQKDEQQEQKEQKQQQEQKNKDNDEQEQQQQEDKKEQQSRDQQQKNKEQHDKQPSTQSEQQKKDDEKKEEQSEKKAEQPQKPQEQSATSRKKGSKEEQYQAQLEKLLAQHEQEDGQLNKQMMRLMANKNKAEVNEVNNW